MTDHEKSMVIINGLRSTLSYVKIGEIIDCSWQSVQKKVSNINYNRFTSDDLKKLNKYIKKSKKDGLSI